MVSDIVRTNQRWTMLDLSSSFKLKAGRRRAMWRSFPKCGQVEPRDARSDTAVAARSDAIAVRPMDARKPLLILRY